MIKTFVFPSPLILNDFSMRMGTTTFWMDRSCQCGHFGLCTCLKKLICRTKIRWEVHFSIYCFFDPTCPFQVQPLCGQGWWVPYSYWFVPKMPPIAESKGVHFCTSVSTPSPITPFYWTVCIMCHVIHYWTFTKCWNHQTIICSDHFLENKKWIDHEV